jgi:hypothetical protein
MLPTKMAAVLLLALLTIAGLASGRQIHVYNRLGYPVWVGILGNSGKGQPDNGGFALNNGQRVSRGQEVAGVELGLPRKEITLRLLGKQGSREEYLDLGGRK